MKHKRLSQIPYQDNLKSSLVCTTVSNALDKSIYSTPILTPESRPKIQSHYCNSLDNTVGLFVAGVVFRQDTNLLSILLIFIEITVFNILY